MCFLRVSEGGGGSVSVCVWVCCVDGWVVPACVLVVVSGGGRLDGCLLQEAA